MAVANTRERTYLTSKTCVMCKSEKDRSQFNRDNSLSDGLGSYCRDCAKIKWAEHRARAKLGNLERFKRSQRGRTLKYRQGIGNDQYDLMFKECGGLCQICGETEKVRKYLVVDHCHETGKIRGLLCHPCNVSLGLMKDNTNTMRRAIEYLELHAIEH
jgi:hypothetical protein